MGFRFDFVKKTDPELKLFVEKLIEYIPYLNHYYYDEELKKLKQHSNAFFYWIKKNDKIIGTIKIRRDSLFYRLGLSPDLSDDDIYNVFDLIERNMTFLYPKSRYYGKVNSFLYPYAINFGFTYEYSRVKMELSIDNARNLSDYHDLNLVKYNETMLSSMVEMFVDAYSGTIDEKIGMFGRSFAYNAIYSVIKGEYGDFDPDLSAIVMDGNDVVAASLISLSEGGAFIVIIGVGKKAQNKGMGRKLISYNIDKSREYGLNSIKLWVTVENTRALHLYSSLGFKEQSRIFSIFKY